MSEGLRDRAWGAAPLSAADAEPVFGAAPPSAGRLLRDARQARGLSVAALARSIRIAPGKLEALEADRYEALFDVAFTRAFARTVCRALQIDAAPVMALLPAAQVHRLEQLGAGLNTPFRERPARLMPIGWGHLARAAVWGPALVLVAAVALYITPPEVLSLASLQALLLLPAGGAATRVPAATIDAALQGGPPPESSTSADATTTQSTAATPAEQPAPAAPAETAAGSAAIVNEAEAPLATAAGASPDTPLAAAADASKAAPPGAASLLQVQASATSWVQVIDAHGRALLSRLLQPGESVALDGALPLQVRIGNAADTRLVFRGQPMALERYTRDNLARLELK